MLREKITSQRRGEEDNKCCVTDCLENETLHNLLQNDISILFVALLIDGRLWIACVRDRLYIRTPGVSPVSLLVISTEDLSGRSIAFFDAFFK